MSEVHLNKAVHFVKVCSFEVNKIIFKNQHSFAKQYMFSLFFSVLITVDLIDIIFHC